MSGSVSHAIDAISATEILDSRGNPTVAVRLALSNGVVACASVPSGASTGEYEAVELRDGDPRRYQGKGVLKAVAHVNEIIAPALRGADPFDQAAIDRRLIDLDGTSNKSRLGANAILGVSQAVARAAARARGMPLYAYLALGEIRVPMPMINIMNGGKHADSGMDFQEFMIVPVGAPSFAEALRYAAETFHVLKGLLQKRGLATAVGDEGGFAPALDGNAAACDLIVEAIAAAGYRPGTDIALALDPAASSFYADGRYRLERSGQGALTAAQMTDLYQDWLQRYPIISLEDGLAEHDWAGFREQTARLGDRIQIVGDDILVTNTRFIERAIAERTCNAALIKPNQIGTVTETIAAIELCREAGWGYVISHRSGETDDTFIADFAVAMGGGQIKAGSVSRGERIAKYNRLLAIEHELGASAIFGPAP